MPQVPYRRYADPGMQEVYARLYAALKTPAIAGFSVVPDDQADALSRQVVDAILAIPQSAELRLRATCAARDIAATPLLGVLAVGLAAIAGYTGYRLYKSRSSSSSRA